MLDYNAFFILFIVLMGFFPIFRGGKWNWKVVRRSNVLSAVFWFGWFSALVVGLLVLFGVG
jgi:hypothetical protein